MGHAVPGGGVRVLPVADVLQWLVHMRKPLVAQLEVSGARVVSQLEIYVQFHLNY